MDQNTEKKDISEIVAKQVLDVASLAQSQGITNQELLTYLTRLYVTAVNSLPTSTLTGLNTTSCREQVYDIIYPSDREIKRKFGQLYLSTDGMVRTELSASLRECNSFCTDKQFRFIEDASRSPQPVSLSVAETLRNLPGKEVYVVYIKPGVSIEKQGLEAIFNL